MARELGAWALGFVFAPSPRRLTSSAARSLIDQAAAVTLEPPASAMVAPRFPVTVGVFGDQSAEEIARHVIEVGLDAVQLHGTAGPEAFEVREALEGRQALLRLASGRVAEAGESCAASPAILIIRAVAVQPEQLDGNALKRTIARAGVSADLLVLDTSVGGRFGGTGAQFHWTVARELDEGLPFLVAGGINPDNARDALRESGAWGIDVSSGVEASPGVKNIGLMRRLAACVINDRKED